MKTPPRYKQTTKLTREHMQQPELQELARELYSYIPAALRYLERSPAARTPGLGVVIPQEREDIAYAALLWCIEHHAAVLVTPTSYKTWFFNAVRDQYKKWVVRHSRETPVAPVGGENEEGEAYRTSPLEFLQGFGRSDNPTLLDACVQHSEERLRALVPEKYRRVLDLELQGLKRPEMVRRGLPLRLINEARAYFKAMDPQARAYLQTIILGQSRPT